MSYRRSSVKGAASFRRLLRQLPDGADAALVGLLNRAGPPLAADMKSRIPVLRSPRKDRVPGAARDGVSFKVNQKSKTLKVGLLGTPRGRAKLFYAHILDVGRKAQIVPIKHGSHAGSSLHVTALAPLNLVRRGLADFRQRFLPDYRKLMNDVLLTAAKGGGDD